MNRRRSHRHQLHPARSQRGAALLTAMVIVVLITTMAASMVWQQWRAVQVESAERARAQSFWVLNGALDWARLILREDARSGNGVDHLGEPWATPLAEARLSSFLAVDRENTDDAPDAFLSGGIVDVQSRYNLRNLIDQGRVQPEELKAFQRLCESVGVPPSVAAGVAEGLRQAVLGTDLATIGQNGGQVSGQAGGSATGQSAEPLAPVSENPPLLPQSIDQLVWLGVDPAMLNRLRPYITMLPQVTPVNVNTAPKEVIAAMVEGLDLGSAERLVQRRQRNPFNSLDEVSDALGHKAIDSRRLGVSSSYFEVQGRLRFEDRVIEQRYLVERRGQDVVTLHQERLSGLE
jgi:general secretion pathway protein K